MEMKQKQKKKEQTNWKLNRNKEQIAKRESSKPNPEETEARAN